MTLGNKIASGVIWNDINRFKFTGHTKDFENGTYCHSVQSQTTRVKVGGNALALKKVQLIPCTVFLYTLQKKQGQKFVHKNVS